MADYKRMYSRLFNAITDAIHLLQQAQRTTEEMFISQQETHITILKQPEEEKE